MTARKEDKSVHTQQYCTKFCFNTRYRSERLICIIVDFHLHLL